MQNGEPDFECALIFRVLINRVQSVVRPQLILVGNFFIKHSSERQRLEPKLRALFIWLEAVT